MPMIFVFTQMLLPFQCIVLKQLMRAHKYHERMNWSGTVFLGIVYLSHGIDRMK